ncbi:MAG: hypothetical protein KKD77_20375 [Gammaproteobacteria bacterium]|nr:hypothetical protein [Gammaproteobacteria bacterium]
MTDRFKCDLEFEQELGAMPDRKLLEFVARQALETSRRCKDHTVRLITLEGGNRKQSSIIGGITGTIAGIIIAIINYFVGKN